MFKWLKPAPAIERLPADMIDRVYRLLRIRVLIGISVGYAAYYLVRSNFTLSSTYLVQEYGFSTAEIGLLGSVMAIVYGFSKFLWGIYRIKPSPSALSRSVYFIRSCKHLLRFCIFIWDDCYITCC